MVVTQEYEESRLWVTGEQLKMKSYFLFDLKKKG